MTKGLNFFCCDYVGHEVLWIGDSLMKFAIVHVAGSEFALPTKDSTIISPRVRTTSKVQHVKQTYVNSLNCHLILSSAALFAFHWGYLAREFGCCLFMILLNKYRPLSWQQQKA